MSQQGYDDMIAIIRGDGIDYCPIDEALGHPTAVKPTALIPRRDSEWISAWYTCQRCGYHWTRPWPKRHHITPAAAARQSNKPRTRRLSWEDEHQ